MNKLELLRALAEEFANVGDKVKVTNGDVIKALFPDNSRDFLIVNMDRNDWWNAPYKAESEGEK